MFFEDPKKVAMTIIAKRHPRTSELLSSDPMKEEHVKTEDGQADGRHVAAQEIISAHNQGSAQKLSEALSSFLDMHHSGAETPPEV